MRTVIRYSEAFKLQVIRELESGKFSSPGEAGKAYGVKGIHTVGKWARKYGKNHLISKVIRVMNADEQEEVKVLRKRMRDLERALATAHLDLKLNDAYLQIACRSAGIDDVDGFKKKHAGKQ